MMFRMLENNNKVPQIGHKGCRYETPPKITLNFFLRNGFMTDKNKQQLSIFSAPLHPYQPTKKIGPTSRTRERETKI